MYVRKIMYLFPLVDLLMYTLPRGESDRYRTRQVVIILVRQIEIQLELVWCQDKVQTDRGSSVCQFRFGGLVGAVTIFGLLFRFCLV